MFESLDEEIKATERDVDRPGGRLLRFMVIAVVSLVVFGAVFAAITLLE